MQTEILENGCIVEHTPEEGFIRVTVWKPDRSLSVTARRTQEYIEHDPHYRIGIEEQAAGLLLHQDAN